MNTTVPHVLVVTETRGVKDWEVEHPETCPRACWWWPGAAADPLSAEYITCYVAFEVENVGLDSLTVVSHLKLGRYGWRDVAPVDLDPPTSPFDAEWGRLRPGRYLIVGWWTPQGWAGTEPVDADGGLTLIGVAP